MERNGEILTHVTQKDIELLKTNPNRFWRGIKEIGYRDGKHGKFGLTGAFCCADIENIEIPEGVNSIGLCAFAKCDKLKAITFPNSLQNINSNAFQMCCALENVVIPENVDFIGANCFYGCNGLKSVLLPKDIKKIGQGAFAFCEELEEIEIPEGVTVIEAKTFENCKNLRKVKLPKSLEVIDEKAFYNCCALEEIEISKSVRGICDYAFYGCKNLKKLVLPKSLVWVGENAFAKCDKVEIDVPEKVMRTYRNEFLCCDCKIIKMTDEEKRLDEELRANKFYALKADSRNLEWCEQKDSDGGRI